jgi:hypothetical protein
VQVEEDQDRQGKHAHDSTDPSLGLDYLVDLLIGLFDLD